MNTTLNNSDAYVTWLRTNNHPTCMPGITSIPDLAELLTKTNNSDHLRIQLESTTEGLADPLNLGKEKSADIFAGWACSSVLFNRIREQAALDEYLASTTSKA